MSGPMSCETCARFEFLVAAGCWCPVLGRMLEEGEMDDYPPCGCARWMPSEKRKEEEDGYGE